MDRTLYLHIGYGRCGSSSIQRFAAGQRAGLLNRGVAYPSAADMGFDGEWLGGNGLPLAEAEDQDDAVARVADYVGASDSQKILISAEQLLTAREATLTDLAGRLRKIGVRTVGIVYVREQREWLVSRWAQGLKALGWTESLDDYLLRFAAEGFVATGLDYHRRGVILRGVFGPENLVIRRLQPDALTRGDVRNDLMSVVGVDADDLIDAEPRRNTSASLEELVLLRILNGLPARGIFNRRAFLRSAGKTFRRKGRELRRDVYRLAAPDTMRVIADHYAPDNERFRRAFMPDVPAPLFASAVPDDYEMLVEDDCVSTETLEFAANFLLILAQRHLRRMEERLEHAVADVSA